MIWQHVDNWRYFLILDITDQEQGVKFFDCDKSQSVFKVIFAFNSMVCLDWAQLSRKDFFEKYSKKGRADKSCLYAEYYIYEKAQTMKPEKRKKFNLRMVLS